jgi:hypothetical protein
VKFKDSPIEFFTPGLGALAYHLLLANRGRRAAPDDVGDATESASRKSTRLTLWKRPSSIMVIVFGGFFIFRAVTQPSRDANWFALEIIFCLAFVIRDWENRAYRNL